jgi:alcohol dehydrogenase (NADP+)
MEALLKLATEKNIKPWAEVMDIAEQNLKLEFEKQQDNTFRYRCTFAGFDEAFGKA